MLSIEEFITAFCSLTLRVGAYVFLRWIPGHHIPPILTAVTLVYCVAFLNCFQSTSTYQLLADDIDIVTNPVHSSDPDLAQAKVAAAAASSSDPLSSKEETVEELDVQETIILELKEPRILRTLLTGLPSPSSVAWSITTLFFNLSLFVMVLDLTYRGAVFYPAHDLSFARLGYVSAETANILVREPDPDRLPLELQYRPVDTAVSLDLGYHQVGTTWKLAGSVDTLTKETDFTFAFHVDSLSSDTRYEWKLSNGHNGYFITAPPIGTVSRRVEAEGRLSFVHSSCIIPHFPYNIYDHPLTIPGFKYLSQWLSNLRPAFMLFLGDFIYADVPMRHGSDAETYRRAYRHVYASPEWPLVSSTRYSASEKPGREYDIPWIHVYDDHEIANDWDQNTTGLYESAFDPYQHYHVSVNPAPLHSPSSSSQHLSSSSGPQEEIRAATTYSTFTHGPATFFMIDTRRDRTPSNVSDPYDPRATILGPTQLHELLAWLAQPLPHGVHWKILVSSVPFTKNWRVNSADTWSGYLHERRIILEAMWSFAAHDPTSSVVVLSGDRHEFAMTAFPPPQTGESHAGAGTENPARHESKTWPLSATVHEFSASPLSMFYLPLRTYRQLDSEDVCVKYIPDGNNKFGAVEILPAQGNTVSSQLRYRLFVDGQERWDYVLTAGQGPAASPLGKSRPGEEAAAAA